MTDLESKLRALLEAFPAKSSLYCVDMASGQPLAAINEQARVVSASTIKLPVLCCALDAVLQGTFSLSQFVPIEESDFCPDTQVFETEYRRDGASLWETLYWMIVESDNTATNAVLRLLSFDRINDYCRGLALTKTCAQRKMLDFEAARQGRQNYTSPYDQFRVYDLLFRGEILNEALRAVAFDFLGRVRHMDGLQRYIPDPVTIYHKPGGLDFLCHDAGIILLPERPYFLGIFTWDGPSPEGDPRQSRFLGQLSRLVYDSLRNEVLG